MVGRYIIYHYRYFLVTKPFVFRLNISHLLIQNIKLYSDRSVSSTAHLYFCCPCDQRDMGQVLHSFSLFYGGGLTHYEKLWNVWVINSIAQFLISYCRSLKSSRVYIYIYAFSRAFAALMVVTSKNYQRYSHNMPYPTTREKKTRERHWKMALLQAVWLKYIRADVCWTSPRP